MLDRTDQEVKMVLGQLPTSAKPGALESLARTVSVPVWRPITAPEFLCEAETFTGVCPRHRIIGSFSLQKALKIIKSDHKPEIAKPSTDPDLGIARCSPGS